jgi:hypothetical protein
MAKSPQQKEAEKLAKDRRRLGRGRGKRVRKNLGTKMKHANGHNDGLPKTPTE